MKGLKPDQHEEPADQDLVEVSLNSLAGLTSLRSMKLRGKIGGRDVLVLVDSGASHNFISRSLVEEEGILTNDRGKFRVILGNKQAEESRGLCTGMRLELSGYTVQGDFLPLRMGGTESILG
ncbi:hypothetical protein QQ045_007384 [Rhodiola kirilowii]